MRRGLSPVAQLRTRLAAVHSGAERRVDGAYPAEVQPLVDDLNALLDHQDQTVQRAVGKAGDLAHGLKTPLALLAQEAEAAQASATKPSLPRSRSRSIGCDGRSITIWHMHGRLPQAPCLAPARR